MCMGATEEAKLDALALRCKKARADAARDKLFAAIARASNATIAKIVYGNGRLDPDDLRQIVLMSLYEAVRTYDPTRGHFTPYAATCMRRRVCTQYQIKGHPKNRANEAALHYNATDNDGNELATIMSALTEAEDGYRSAEDREALNHFLTLLTSYLTGRERMVLRALLAYEKCYAAGGIFPFVQAFVARKYNVRLTRKAIDNTIQRLRRKAIDIMPLALRSLGIDAMKVKGRRYRSKS
jgi:RNA polymerase sigma factor (sigma-70 family)